MGALSFLLPALLVWPYFLANLDLFFTLVKEGEAKIIIAGQSYVRTIVSLAGHEVNQSGDIVPSTTVRQKSLFERWYGAFWIGLPPARKIFQYNLRWMSYQPKATGDGEKEPVVKTGILKSTFVKDKVYYGVAKGVETNEGLPLTVEFLITLRVVNPYKAIFLISNWVEAIIDRATQQVRVYVGTKTYKELLTLETSTPTQGFSGYLEVALARTILDAYGVKFVSCDILSVDPPPEYRQVTTRAYTATQNATTITTEATAKATAISSIGNAEAGIITAKGQAEANSLKSRIEQFKENPEAAKALLNADVGRALSIKTIAEAIGTGLGWNITPPDPPTPPNPPAPPNP